MLGESIQRQLSLAAGIQQGPKRGRDHCGRVAEKVARQAKAARSRLDRIERIDKPRASAAIQAAFAPRPRSGEWVIKARGLAVQYGDRSLFRGLDLDVVYGERWGIIGPNGSGKTTYEGTLIVISQDRYLLDRRVDRLVVLGSGSAQRYLGRCSEWEGTATPTDRAFAVKGGPP